MWCKCGANRQNKNPNRLIINILGFLFAERAGFEPAVPCGTQTFQACTFGHSDTSPFNQVAKLIK